MGIFQGNYNCNFWNTDRVGHYGAGITFWAEDSKNFRSGEERRQELKMQRMEEKLNKIKRKRAASEIEKGNAAQEVQGFEVT